MTRLPFPSRAGWSLILAGLLISVTQAPAQVLKRDVPTPRPGGCPEMGEVLPSPPGMEDRQEAVRLLAAARSATILGDQAAARDLLARAATLDPAAENVAYMLARTLEQLDDHEGALAEYCRYLSLAGDAPDAAEVRERVAELAPPRFDSGATAPAVERFLDAIRMYDRARLPEAEAAFTDALREAPDWTAAYYNRAVVRAGQERPDSALADLQRYLRLVQDSTEREAVLAWAARLRTPLPTYRPGVAFASGLLPGFGHFYSGRPLTGFLFLAGAGGAVAAGLTYEVERIECRSRPVDGFCPPDDVNREWTERPYLPHALGAAAAFTLLGAWDAYRGARRRNVRPQAPTAGTATNGAHLSILPPSVSGLGERVRVDWVRLRF